MAKHFLFRDRLTANFRRIASGVALIAALLVVAPSAHAQWAVNDAEANGQLGTIQTNTSNTADNTKDTADNTSETVTQTKDMNKVLGTIGDNYQSTTINGHLEAINSKLAIGTYDNKKPGSRVKDPDKALPKSGGTALNDGTSCKTVAQPQQSTCQEIVALENAQYQYMLLMYETTATRDATLRDLLTEREGIQANDANQFGKLEDNTNKLTALYNLIALDHQQMEAVNYAYDANIRFLRSKQTLAANAASTGKDPTKGDGISIPGIGDVNLGSVISGLSTGAALALALDGVATSTPSGMKTLKIGESNGF